ncbi:hypothetical protein ES288_A07G114000v1 [Gossypium darwinii]|uniref:Uncharacterized protein n=1 Tax=Gossypium darwinii TaxID=34276 RepID=A0A5D2FUC5_GOSDA|nr:hypothetical protein ES288_A07G114000v1 [Gossypium darwinii]
MADQNDPPTAIRSTTTVIGGRPHANGHFQPYFRRVRGVQKRWRFPLPWRSLQQMVTKLLVSLSFVIFLLSGFVLCVDLCFASGVRCVEGQWLVPRAVVARVRRLVAEGMRLGFSSSLFLLKIS